MSNFKIVKTATWVCLQLWNLLQQPSGFCCERTVLSMLHEPTENRKVWILDITVSRGGGNPSGPLMMGVLKHCPYETLHSSETIQLAPNVTRCTARRNRQQGQHAQVALSTAADTHQRRTAASGPTINTSPPDPDCRDNRPSVDDLWTSKAAVGPRRPPNRLVPHITTAPFYTPLHPLVGSESDCCSRSQLVT